MKCWPVVITVVSEGVEINPTYSRTRTHASRRACNAALCRSTVTGNVDSQQCLSRAKQILRNALEGVAGVWSSVMLRGGVGLDKRYVTQYL